MRMTLVTSSSRTLTQNLALTLSLTHTHHRELGRHRNEWTHNKKKTHNIRVTLVTERARTISHSCARTHTRGNPSRLDTRTHTQPHTQTHTRTPTHTHAHTLINFFTHSIEKKVTASQSISKNAQHVDAPLH